MKFFRLFCLLASIAIFGVSLAGDGFYIDRLDDPRAWAPGWVELLLGWILVFGGVIAWLANPLLFLGWILLIRRSTAPLSAGVTAVAALVAASFLLHHEIVTSEGGDKSSITGYGNGYFLWIASIFTAFVGGIIPAGCLLLKSKQRARISANDHGLGGPKDV